jgi:hypothetical protein
VPAGPTTDRGDPVVGQVETLAARIETTTAISTAGILGTSRWSEPISTRPSRPTASAAATVSPLASPLAKPDRLGR